MDVGLRTLVVAVAVVAIGCGRIGFSDLVGGGGDDVDGGGGGDGDVTALSCVPGYVAVLPLAGYTTNAFCVAKYEMRNVQGTAVSQPGDLPWLMITKTQAQAECQALGYSLITNDQWQTIARQIADEGWNWSSGTAYEGVLSSGHSDSNPMIQLAASTDDNPCFGTGNVCSEAMWHDQRRIARLGNGSMVWDFGGNAGEWADGNYAGPEVSDQWVSMLAAPDMRVNTLGNDQRCASAAASPYCGFGFIYTSSVGGAIVRGSGLDWGNGAGVFSGPLWFRDFDTDWNVGFRCAYEP